MSRSSRASLLALPPLPSPEVSAWEAQASRMLGDFRIFSVRELLSRSPTTGSLHDFFVIDSPTWVNVIPLTDEDQVVVIRQYRHGTEEITLEVPGGLVDPGEEPACAALRELREETGYEAEGLILLGTIDPNPAIMSNRCFTYLATGVRLSGLPEPDVTEEIEVLCLPRAELNLRVARGEISHSLVAVALYKLELYRMGLYADAPVLSARALLRGET